jgi:hypothetical protein
MKQVGDRLISYTDEQAVGAYPNGSRVVKTASEPSDDHGNGACATVIGSMSVNGLRPEDLPEAARNASYIYFVEWDDTPGFPVAVIDFKVLRRDQ